MKECMDKIFTYMRTPEYRRRIEDWQKQLQTAMGKDYDAASGNNLNLGK